MTTSGLERLDCWLKAKDLALIVYRQITPFLPADEKFGLISQMRRAAISIPANIAEGYGRYYYQANIQFCYTARGSLEELLSHLVISHDLGYIKDTPFIEVTKIANDLDLMINGYISYLRKSKLGEKDYKSHISIHEDQEDYLIN